MTMALFVTVSEIRPVIAWNFSLKIAANSLQIETWLGYYWQPIESRQRPISCLVYLYVRPNRPHYGSCPSVCLSLTDITDALQQCCRLLTRCRPSLSVVLCNGCIVAKRCKIEPRLLLISNMKSNTGFQMTLKSLTLDDLGRTMVCKLCGIVATR